MLDSFGNQLRGNMKYPNLELIEYITENTACELFESELKMSTYHKFKMYVFPQTWSSTALGFDGCGGQAITEAYTTVVEMTSYKFESGKDIRGIAYKELEDNVYAVFFDGRIAYMCLNPSHEFLVDINNMNMKSQREVMEYYKDKYSKNSRVSIL